jgi:hypothetical protein
MPLAPPPPPTRVDHGGRDTALLGAAICGGVLTVVLIIGALTARSRRD